MVVRNLDLIFLMTFDMHGSWSGRTGLHSPLFGMEGDQGGRQYLNVVGSTTTPEMPNTLVQ